MDCDAIEALLSELLEEVKLLTVKVKSEALQTFYAEFLTSDLRKQIYGSFDGIRTLPQISTDIGCKINTLQVFAQVLVDNDLVSFQTRGNARIINKSPSKIALYYAMKRLEEQ